MLNTIYKEGKRKPPPKIHCPRKDSEPCLWFLLRSKPSMQRRWHSIETLQIVFVVPSTEVFNGKASCNPKPNIASLIVRPSYVITFSFWLGCGIFFRSRFLKMVSLRTFFGSPKELLPRGHLCQVRDEKFDVYLTNLYVFLMRMAFAVLRYNLKTLVDDLVARRYWNLISRCYVNSNFLESYNLLESYPSLILAFSQ